MTGSACPPKAPSPPSRGPLPNPASGGGKGEEPGRVRRVRARRAFARLRLAVCARAERDTYWTGESQSGERDGFATGVTGFATPQGGTAFSVANAGLGLAVGAAVAGARTVGFPGVAAKG
jgi:hypothetical protein